uniref:Uncharacterized protein n=1 Tax=Anguilla anguilla TaxID=7936 RepID=A0A0E9TM19_ANGAN
MSNQNPDGINSSKAKV